MFIVLIVVVQRDSVQGPEIHSSSQDFKQNFHDPEVSYLVVSYCIVL